MLSWRCWQNEDVAALVSKEGLHWFWRIGGIYRAVICGCTLYSLSLVVLGNFCIVGTVWKGRCISVPRGCYAYFMVQGFGKV